ncbi:Flagellar motor rotation protein MotB [hydrothermal vent metagenome]|uniref:Flagellar motor rotation protein MotB n=1 Tax=hydrothermal vent metagenome TaxID=652676 RepID=A0A3B1BFT2_9ZZZZ
MGKRKNPIFEGAPMWIVTFADLATLLLTFFVLLLSFANTDIIKFREMLGSVQGAFGVKIERQGEFQDTLTGEGTVDKEKQKEKKEKALVRQFDKVSQTVSKAAVESKMKDDVEILSTRRGMVIRVKGEALFKSGATKINPKSTPILNSLADILKKTNFTVKVEGHTDNVPVKAGSASLYKSNWEISGVRASVIVRYLISKKVNPENLSAVGYGGMSPVKSNDTAEGRAKNRRVEFLVNKPKP